jgi:hypothetical protein
MPTFEGTDGLSNWNAPEVEQISIVTTELIQALS